MKKIQLNLPGGFDQLQVIECDVPQPRANEVLVRWRATSLNYHDLLVANGTIPVEQHRIPMSDGAGEIVALGEHVEGWSVGDKVMSLFFPNWLDGEPSMDKTKLISGESIDGFALEYSCVAATAITQMPDHMNFVQAATLPCAALTAWRGLFAEGDLKAGESVLIQGSGGMSLFALQFAKAAGATVYATTSDDAKADRLLALGADHVINYKKNADWGKRVAKLSGGVDHVLDIGGPSTLNQSIEAVRIGGHIALIGILGGHTAEMVLPKLFFKHVSLSGIAVGSRAMQIDMVKVINSNKLQPVLDKQFSLGEIALAFKHQLSAQHFGKIVVAI